MFMMKDPRKIASLIIDGRAAPRTPDGAVKNNRPAIESIVDRLFSALESKDRESFIGAFKDLTSTVQDEQADERPENTEFEVGEASGNVSGT